MKNFAKFFGIIALVAIFGFSMIACGGDDNGGPTALGDKLELSGQVYTEKWNITDTSFSYEAYTGADLTINDGVGGEGAVTGGILDYSIEKPNNLMSRNDVLAFFASSFEGAWEDVDISPSDVEIYSFTYLPTDKYGLTKQNSKYNLSSNNSGYSVTNNCDMVIYIYVDRNASFSAKGIKESGSGFSDDDGTPMTYTVSISTNNFNHSLKEGWNALRIQTNTTAAISFGTLAYTGTGTGTGNISLSNPGSHKWVYDSEMEPNISFSIQSDSSESNGSETFEDILNKNKAWQTLSSRPFSKK